MGTPAGEPAPADLPVALEVGNGAAEHVPITAQIDLLGGDGMSQSGAHIEVSGLVTGMSSNIVGIRTWSTGPEGELFTESGDVGPSWTQLADFDPYDGSGWFAGVRSRTLLQGADLCAFAGQTLELCVAIHRSGEVESTAVESCVEARLRVQPTVLDYCG